MVISPVGYLRGVGGFFFCKTNKNWRGNYLKQLVQFNVPQHAGQHFRVAVRVLQGNNVVQRVQNLLDGLQTGLLVGPLIQALRSGPNGHCNGGGDFLLWYWLVVGGSGWLVVAGSGNETEREIEGKKNKRQDRTKSDRE